MYIRFRRTVHPIGFLKKHAHPHVIVGRYDWLGHKDEIDIGPRDLSHRAGIALNASDLVVEQRSDRGLPSRNGYTARSASQTG